jgi:hypothetical protein
MGPDVLPWHGRGFLQWSQSPFEKDQIMRFALPVCLLISAAFPAIAQEKATAESVLAASKAAFAGSCWSLSEEGITGGARTELPVSYDVTIAGDGVFEPTNYVVWEVLCDMAAYNVLYIYWTEGEFGDLRPIAFPKPGYTAEMERADDPESPVKSLALTGWMATSTLINPTFDPATLTFMHFYKYRGVGDAAETGTWVMGHEGVTLVNFEVDASYDGEINPLPLYPAQ